MADPVWRLSAGDVQITLLRPSTVQVLRVLDAPLAMFGRLGKALGLTWPLEPNTVAGDGLAVLWMAPSEWALVGETALDLPAVVAKACGTALHHLADVADGRIVFRVEGARARDIIAKGCSLDLHPRAFGVGRCAQSLLAQAPVLMRQVGPDAFDLLTDVSYARHFQLWFEDATLEYRAA
jgi:sarcosine oxidase subunit gamma